MEQLLDRIFLWANQSPGWIYFFVFAGALLEYLFPPFPGDLSTVLGAILSPQDHRFWKLFLAVNLGSSIGFGLDYAFGIWLADPHRRFRHWSPRWEKLGTGIDRVAALFERHAALYLIANRFLPGLRALFFVAAGFARVPAWKVFSLGLLSSGLWSLLLLSAGAAIGYKRDVLTNWLATYTGVVWAILLALVGLYLLCFFVRRRRGRGHA